MAHVWTVYGLPPISATPLIRALLVVALAAGIALAQAPNAKSELNLGVQAFRNGDYPQAVEHFKQALVLDPDYVVARSYLAAAYMYQYIPGAESEENLRLAQAAHDEYTRVLEQDPRNGNAMLAIAQLYFHQKKLDDALDWYKKAIAINPKDKIPYYTIGVISWSKAYPARMKVRSELGMRPEDAGPLGDANVRALLRIQNSPIIAEGIQALENALALDPEYDDAMAYMNLLYRERADLADTVEGYRNDTNTADLWIDRTIATKKLKAARMPPGAPVER